MNDRRTFLKVLGAVAAAGAAPSVHAAAQAPSRGGVAPRGISPPRIGKSMLINMLPKDLPYAQRFALARECGFDSIEMQTVTRDDEAAEIKDTAAAAGMRIHSVMN